MSGARAAAALAVLVGAAGAVAWTQPRWLARALSRQRFVVVHGATRAREVAVTFDDGPDASLTPRILEVLREHEATATFFVLGSKVGDHPAVVRALVEAGHELGNHGWRDAPAVLAPGARFRRDLERTERAIIASTGFGPVLFRPGSGWVRPAQLRDAAARGCTTVLGSIAVRDLAVRDVARELHFVLRRVQPGSILVLHEGDESRAGVVPFLTLLLPELQRRGYRLVTVSQLLAPAAGRETRQRSIS